MEPRASRMTGILPEVNVFRGGGLSCALHVDVPSSWDTEFICRFDFVTDPVISLKRIVSAHGLACYGSDCISRNKRRHDTGDNLLEMYYRVLKHFLLVLRMHWRRVVLYEV